MTKHRQTNSAVINFWGLDKSAMSWTGNLWTDGSRLFSYSLQIGDTLKNGDKILKEYTASGTYGFKSQTTSCHVGIARWVAKIIL